MKSAPLLLITFIFISCALSLSCNTSEDCPSHQWCRTTREKTTECVDYAKAGEKCGGYVPSFLRAICAPGHSCQLSPSYMTDTHGMCVKNCKSNSDCSENQFCNEDGFCLDHAQCISIKDCVHPDNHASLPRCLYSTECRNNQCLFSCLDLCTKDSECSETHRCYFEQPRDTTGYCLQHCKHTFNCPTEYTCEDGICKDPFTQKSA